MTSYVDRLEENLAAKIGILERIYESDKRIVDAIHSAQNGLEVYDEYIIEQNSYISELDELDLKYDEIYEYLVKHRSEVSAVSSARREKIKTLSKEIEGKMIAVNEMEDKVRGLTETYINNRRSAIQASRKNARVLQNRYKPGPISGSGDNSIFDITN